MGQRTYEHARSSHAPCFCVPPDSRLGLNLPPDLFEIVELLRLGVKELAILLFRGQVRGFDWSRGGRVSSRCCRATAATLVSNGGAIGVWNSVAVRRDVDELEDERASSDDATAPREETLANDSLEDARLAAGSE